MCGSRSGIILVLSIVCTVAIPAPASSQERPPRAAHADPCWTSSTKTVKPPVPPWRAHMSRRAAIHVVQHLRKACRLLSGSSDKDSLPAPLALQVSSIRDSLYVAVLDPIYRAHPELKNAELPELPSPRVLRATPRDIRRTTATRLCDELTSLQQRMSKLGEQSSNQQADKEAAEKALQPVLDAMAELSFAEKIAFDAYPDLFAKNFDAVPQQPRTPESDEAFRKAAPPLGSVRLSDEALALVRSFMRDVRRTAPRSDHVASIGWAREQKSKGPGDADWISKGPGWMLGAFARTQIPPDVIDKVGGIEIVFEAEEPSSLMGKTIDAAGGKLFVRD